MSKNCQIFCSSVITHYDSITLKPALCHLDAWSRKGAERVHRNFQPDRVTQWAEGVRNHKRHEGFSVQPDNTNRIAPARGVRFSPVSF